MASARPPGYLDRYPAKMVGRLAQSLVLRHCADAKLLLDPFCGSGAVLEAAAHVGLRATGWDVNPYATLLSSVKASGFDAEAADRLAERCVARARRSGAKRLAVTLPGFDYWFTPKTLDKFERLRAVFAEMEVRRTSEGRAVLLACALSVRRCSRADQRSPKPFVSRIAIESRRGRHFDPFTELRSLLRRLGTFYSPPRHATTHVVVRDARLLRSVAMPSVSHVLTSPPYLNAQDYYRNFRLELAILEGVLPFDASLIQASMIGTERGVTDLAAANRCRQRLSRSVPGWRSFAREKPRHAWIVARYVEDMRRAFRTIDRYLMPGGRFVLVCGDNLVGGLHIRTSNLLGELLSRELGYLLQTTHRDRIRRRYLAPQRSGHKSIIKTETIAVFMKPKGKGRRRAAA